MKIGFHNIVGGVFQAKGPQVDFELSDGGQANVTIHVALSDGTHIDFPDGSGPGVSRSTVLPPGDYNCVVQIAALGHGSFGRTYKSVVKVSGVKAASASGTLPAGTDVDSDIDFFVVRVS